MRDVALFVEDRARRRFVGALAERPACATPDPRVERWSRLDGAAFRSAVGRGCDAPGLKCDRDRYRRLVVEAVRAAGISPILGGMEFAEETSPARAARVDGSFKRFVDALDGVFQVWRWP